MNIFNRYLSFIACWGLLLVGCGQGGSEFGNPSRLNISVFGYQQSQLQGLGLSAITVNDLTVDVAHVVLGEIHFRPFSACATELDDDDQIDPIDEITFEGPFVVDLLQMTTIDALEGITVPNQLYCRIELKMKKLESNISPMSSIFGRSVLIEGTRADATPFQVTLEVDDEFKLENDMTGFVVDGVQMPTRLFIAFEIDQWFTGVDLNDPNVEISTDGNSDPIILIDDNHNSQIREQIITNLQLSAELFKDENQDDELDQDEQSEPLAAGEPIAGRDG